MRNRIAGVAMAIGLAATAIVQAKAQDMIEDPVTARYSRVIEAPADKVWRTIRPFGRVADWNPIATSSRIVGDGRDDAVGSERELALAPGGTVRERLVALDDENRTLAYAMLTFPIPVTWQVGRIGVEPLEDGARSVVTWSARFIPAPGHEAAEIRDINLGAYRLAADGLAAGLKTR